jgi:hypothetical protein
VISENAALVPQVVATVNRLTIISEANVPVVHHQFATNEPVDETDKNLDNPPVAQVELTSNQIKRNKSKDNRYIYIQKGCRKSLWKLLSLRNVIKPIIPKTLEMKI